MPEKAIEELQKRKGYVPLNEFRGTLVKHGMVLRKPFIQHKRKSFQKRDI